MATSLSLVIPAFNEEKRLAAGLQKLVQGVNSDNTEILVVDDGSTDNTAEVARRQLESWPKHSVVSMGRNCGKGAAVRNGVIKARGDVIAFVDADMATDPRDLAPLVRALEGNHVAVGSRTLDASVVDDRSTHRAVMTRTFGLLVGSLMQIPLGDTQCGFKAFKGSIAKLLFHGSRVNSFAFDVEVLNLAVRLGLRTQEVPVRWTDREGSHVRPIQDAVQMLTDVARTRMTWRIQPPMQGVFMPDVPIEAAAPLVRSHIRNVDLMIKWKEGTAILLPCLPPTLAHRASCRLVTSLQAYDPQMLSVEFSALFSPASVIESHSRGWVG